MKIYAITENLEIVYGEMPVGFDNYAIYTSVELECIKRRNS